LIFGFRGHRFPKPWQYEEEAGKHFGEFARENRFVGQMTLLNLDIKPSTDGLEEFEEAEHKHPDSQQQR
jgi:hypothetical protein